MFLNSFTGGDSFRRIVVRLCACLLIVGLVGQTLVLGPLQSAKAETRVLTSVQTPPAPISAPPAPFEVSNDGSVRSLLPATSSMVASLFAFLAPKSKEPSDRRTGFENAVLEPLRNSERETPNTPLSTLNSPLPPAGDVEFDFDNDSKADIGRWRGVATEFKTKNSGSSGYSTYTLGTSSAVAAPGDFNGDGQTDACVFNGTTWTYKTSPSASADTITFGSAGDIPYAGDYDGDGITDAAVFRPSTNYWWIRQSSNSATVSYNWGAAGDIPITGNWDGDSKTDIAVYRSGTWYIQKSSGGNLYLYWGLSYDIPVQGDFDGDGKSDATVFRPTTGTWYVLKSGSGFTAYSATNWGVWSDQPVPADYDGDSITDLAIWRPTDGNWYVLKSSTNTHEIHTLGISGDTAVPSSYTKQVGGPASGDVINAERVKPRNATGGTNLYSQNFGWGTSLVGLPGRAGLDAGFGIGYNSLIWLKVGNSMYFNPDQSNVGTNAGVGFRMGFPVIEPIYYDNDKQKWSYMMVTPSGSRIEFRQTAASNVYETADSSYTQLVVTGASNPFDPVENLVVKVTTTDGTQMTYAWGLNSYKCTQIKDRNGNYITLAYDSIARLSTMTDTLGRVVTVNYDANTGLPSTITQTWKDNNGQGSNVTHTWATFAYTTKTVDTDFATSLAVVGPPDGTVLTVLDKITYADTSWTKFYYNGYLQVEKIENYADDDHKLNHVTTNLASVTGSQSDCPRFTETKTYAENFNSGNEVAVTNSFTTGSSYSLPNSISGSATKVTVAVTNHPDSLRTKIYYGASGYKEGLTLATEDCISDACTGTDRKRWTWTDWTQDDTSAGYITNPRVVESRVGDGTNTKKTTVGYGSNGFGLPEEVKVYDADLTTVLKTQTTSYSTDSAYLNRRIIGLPTETKLYEGTTSGALMSKITFGYDGSYTGTGQSLSSATQHDTSAYGTSLSYRGNQTSTRRWNVTYPTTQSESVESTVKYNIAGSPISKTTPWDGTNTRTVSIGYADSWNDGTSRTTYAYPTTLTDPASNSSTIKYRYDIGANVEASSPAPTGQTYGLTTKRIFDSIGRMQRNSVYVNTTEKGYVRYEFPSNGIQSVSYAPIIDADGDGNIAEDEVYSESWLDGAGRVRKNRTEHPGSTGGWSATQTEYDILGRVYRSSVPTEVSVSGTTWTAAGDDATRGWIWNYAYYDWKDRVVRTVPSDSTGSDGKDTLISYEGCGCAGGEITTVQGPLVPRDDTSGTARRTQKTYADTLGRAFKSETYQWDGSTVYSTVVNTFNGRDQVTLSRAYAGTTSSSTYQDTTATFDGHGRLATKHIPQQNTSTATVYNYNLDDSIQTVTDARGAVTNYTYNSRGLVTNIGWTVPSGSGIADPTDITFSYDNLGNRTQMTDGLGTTTYSYDSLSQLASESRGFTGLTGSFAISYEYAISGGLKKITDPSGVAINYAYDKAGRMNAVTGSGTLLSSVSDYASNFTYRAWGAVKSMSYGNSISTATTYNNRLQMAAYTLSGVKATSTSSTHDEGSEFTYYPDGQLKFASDTRTNSPHQRAFEYDHQGRITEGYSSYQAMDFINNTTTTNGGVVPFRHSYQYDAFSNRTERSGVIWSELDEGEDSYNSQGRNSAWSYDADGRLLTRSESSPNGLTYSPLTFTYDAAGQKATQAQTVSRPHPSNPSLTLTTISTGTDIYDGNGALVKKTRTIQLDTGTPSTETTYYLSSTLTGAVVNEYNGSGTKTKTNVHASGQMIARETSDGTTSQLLWQQTRPMGDGVTTTTGAVVNERISPDPVAGFNVGDNDPFPSGGGTSEGGGAMPGITSGLDGPQCSIDGMTTECGLANTTLAAGAGAQCPNNICSTIHNPRDINGDGTIDTYWDTFRAYADGYQGYGPAFGALYAGDGRYRLPRRGGPPQLKKRTAESPRSPGDSRPRGPNADNEAEDSIISGQMSCPDALNQAGKTQGGLQRAQAALPQIMQIVDDVNIARLLAAIGIQESDFVSRNQIGGGPGRGVFQIEPNTYGITEADANNLQSAVNAIANNWSRSWTDTLTAFDNGGYDTSSSYIQYKVLAGLARIHNRGRSGVVSADKKGNVSIGALLDRATRNGDITILDNTGTNRDRRYTETANGTYVRNVMDLFFSCFGG